MKITCLPISAAFLLATIAFDASAEPPRFRVEHKSEALCLTWSPDGKSLLTCSQDGMIHIIDVSRGKEVRSFPTENPAGALAVSPDGSTLAVHHPPPTMTVDTWDIGSGSKTESFYTFQSVRLLAFAESGQELVLAGLGQFWQCGLNGTSPSIERLPNPDEGAVGVAPDGSAYGWCHPKGQLQVRIRSKTGILAPLLNVASADCIAFGPGGSLLALGGSAYKSVQLWDLTKEKKRATLIGSPKPAAALSISADGKTVAAMSADGYSIEIWDAIQSESMRHINTFSRPASSLALSPDGKMVAAVESGGQAILIWPVTAASVPLTGPRAKSSPQELAGYWTDLTSSDNDKALQAWRKLGAAGDSAGPLLRQKVRSITNSMAAVRRAIDKLAADLDSDKFPVRERALRELPAFGDLAFHSLQRLVQTPPSLEAATRANLLLKKLKEPRLTPDCFLVLETIDLLEQMRTALAIDLLQEIEANADVGPIQWEAQQALERIAQKK